MEVRKPHKANYNPFFLCEVILLELLNLFYTECTNLDYTLHFYLIVVLELVLVLFLESLVFALCKDTKKAPTKSRGLICYAVALSGANIGITFPFIYSINQYYPFIASQNQIQPHFLRWIPLPFLRTFSTVLQLRIASRISSGVLIIEDYTILTSEFILRLMWSWRDSNPRPYKNLNNPID